MPQFYFDAVIADDVVCRDGDGTEYPDQSSALTEARLVVGLMTVEKVRLGKSIETLSIVVRSGETALMRLSLQEAATKLQAL